jgi:hypothetical protein
MIENDRTVDHLINAIAPLVTSSAPETGPTQEYSQEHPPLDRLAHRATLSRLCAERRKNDRQYGVSEASFKCHSGTPRGKLLPPGNTGEAGALHG